LHCLGQAIDINDSDGALDMFCMANSEDGGLLEQIGLWLEHPDSTTSWCHVQIVPPGSGKRVFHP
jgi:hypothetical protein